MLIYIKQVFSTEWELNINYYFYYYGVRSLLPKQCHWINGQKLVAKIRNKNI